MVFLTTDDFNGIIAAGTLADLRGNNDANLIKAGGLAISELDPLRANHNVDAELLKTGSNRNDMLVRMLVHITAYYLFNTVEDVEIPERIDENYRMQIKNIKEIATGKLSSSLDTLTDEVSGLPKSNYRWGGDGPRDNEIF